MPRTVQRASATAKASCIASSARSNEPHSRIRLAMIRPCSWRNTDSTVALASGISARRWLPRGKFHHRADLDAARAALAPRRNSGSPGNRLVEILAVENVVPGELPLGFREGSVMNQRLATAIRADRRRGRGGMQRLGPVEDALCPRFVDDRPVRRL